MDLNHIPKFSCQPTLIHEPQVIRSTELFQIIQKRLLAAN